MRQFLSGGAGEEKPGDAFGGVTRDDDDDEEGSETESGTGDEDDEDDEDFPEFGGQLGDEDMEGSEASADENHRHRQRKGNRHTPDLRYVRVGDLLRVTDPLDMPDLSLAMECYGLDASRGLRGCIGRVLKVNTTTHKLLMGFHITPQGLWFSLWLTVYQLENLPQDGPGSEALSQASLTATLTYLTAQNVALQLLSKISRDPASLTASLPPAGVQAQSATFLGFLKTTVGSLLPLSPRFDDQPRNSADAWTGELETRLFGSPAATTPTAAPQPLHHHPHPHPPPPLHRRRGSVAWLEGVSKSFVSQHLFAELDLKMETLSTKDYTFRALAICRNALLRVIEQEWQAAKAAGTEPTRQGPFSTIFLESLREAFEPSAENLGVSKAQSTQPLPKGPFSEVVKVEVPALRAPLILTFVTNLCGIDFTQDRVAFYQTESLSGEPLKVIGKGSGHAWHTFLLPTNRFWVQ